MMGMLPKKPWYPGTSFADYIVISGADEVAMYAEAEENLDKLLYYGTHELDALHERYRDHEQLRRRFIETYDMDQNKRIFMVALPRVDLWELNRASGSEYRDIVGGVLKVLVEKDFNVVGSLHPYADPADYDWIEEKFPIKICREPLRDILVVADLFAAAYSSTLKWAVALGIPVINLDLWDRNVEVFKNLAGYQTITSIDEFDELVRHLEADPDNGVFKNSSSPNNSLADHIQNPSDGHGQQWSGVLFDGKAKAHLLRFIQSLDEPATSTAVGSVPTERVL
jgi:hypothetical protein